MSALPAGLPIVEKTLCQPAKDAGMEKQFSTLRARAALVGIVLVKSHDDRGQPEYIASMYALTKAFGTLDELGRWLERVEGKR